MNLTIFEKVIAAHGVTGAAVYGIIYRECLAHYGICVMPHSEIAQRLGLCTASVAAHAKKLETAGLVAAHKTFGRATRYTVPDVPVLHECERGNDE